MMMSDDNKLKLTLYAQKLPDDAIAEWLGYYEKATSKGDDAETASDYAWDMLKKKWRKADNGRWVKLEIVSLGWASDIVSQPSPVIEVFRAGEYPQGTITIEDLDTMVQNYDPSIFEAPVTIDHIKAGPAYGWVSTIFRQGDRLFAVLRDLKDKFKQLVKGGEYRNRSIEIAELEYKGERIWPYFSAVTFLGAKWPQVKGMAEPVFLSMADGYISAGCYSMDVKNIIGFPIDETDDSIRIRQRNPGDFEPNSFRTIKLPGAKGIKAVIGKLKGKTSTTIQIYIFDKKAWTVDKAKAWVKEHSGKMSIEDLKSLYDNGGILTMEITQEQFDVKLKEASKAGGEKAVADFKTKHDIEKQKKDFDDQAVEVKKLKASLLDKEKVNAQQFALSQFDHLVSQGKVLPAEKEMFMSMMTILSPDKAEIKFSSDFTGTPAKAFVEFFNAMKPRVDLKHRTADDPNKKDKTTRKQKKGGIAEGANEITLKRQEYMEENLPAAMKEANDPKKGTDEWKLCFNAVYRDACEETEE